MAIRCWAALAPGEPLRPFSYEPAPLGPADVEIAITHCGVCRSDLDLVDGIGPGSPPVVPGHEIAGVVTGLGAEVRDLRRGQRVGVGWQCGACFGCEWCARGLEQYCAGGIATCDGRCGGFAEAIRVDARFAHPLPGGLAPEVAAPLLCAGVTVAAPLLEHGLGPSSRVGVLGIGGLGHVALQYARALGCAVTAISSTAAKRADAERFGAGGFLLLDDEADLARAASSLDFILSTAHVNLELGPLLALLRPGGRLCFVGLPPRRPVGLRVGDLVDLGKWIGGSTTGSRATARRALELAAEHGIAPAVEVLPMAEAPRALERLRAGRAGYRLVLAN